MSHPKQIIAEGNHRGWPLPQTKWSYYQEWNQALFFHWPISPEKLRPLVPQALALDTTEGKAWVSLVPFTMENARPRGLPAVRMVSTFHEVNVRTYVVRNGIPGVYFFSLEAGNRLANFVARNLSGMPYRFANLRRKDNLYLANHTARKSSLSIQYEVGDPMEGSPLDLWLTERYSVHQEAFGTLKTFEVLHRPWPLHHLHVSNFQLDYPEFSELLQGPPACMAYSPGVPVVAWPPY